MERSTIVSIDGPAFALNGRPTYPGRTYRGMKIEGLLMNARLVQGVFDDLNPPTRRLWDYPDGPWDPQRNTDEFVAAMPTWRKAGLLSFTINLQGGIPQGCGGDQPWHNSAFEADGGLRPDYMSRLAQILDSAAALAMAPILGLFYFGQDQRLADERAVLAAADNVVDWLMARGDANVLVEIANEVDVPAYTHEIIRPDRVVELIRRVQERSADGVGSPAGRLLVGASTGGGALPSEPIVQASDFLLLHGNGVGDPGRIGWMVRQCRQMGPYRGQPILFNEDDHFDFEADRNNMLSAIGEYASWGLFDYRKDGEGYGDGFQSVPVDWQIRSARKRGFFHLLADVTGGEPPS